VAGFVVSGPVSPIVGTSLLAGAALQVSLMLAVMALAGAPPAARPLSRIYREQRHLSRL
jgi:hypothetical protein